MSTADNSAAVLLSDHLPITVTMALSSSAPPPAPPASRPRLAWDHHTAPEVWKAALPDALSHALLQLQPRLVQLAAAASPSSQAPQPPLPAHLTPQQLLDSVYEEFEETLAETCLGLIGTRVVHRASRAWFRHPGVKPAYAELRRASKATIAHPADDNLHATYWKARRAWTEVSSTAKQEEYAALCSAVAARDPQARWALFKRTAPSAHSPLSSILHPDTKQQPASHHQSLDNLCASFIKYAAPPAPGNPQLFAAQTARVTAWATPGPTAIPAHHSDGWYFSMGLVRRQCRHQHTNSAPGPDSILPIFLKHAGDTCWQALATIYTFSWRFSVTPRAWREANVMALYKGSGSKADSRSYRPISMTSIIARTFEHLIHQRLIQELDCRAEDMHHAPPASQPPAGTQLPKFSSTQFGFRRGRTTYDAIHYLVSNVQRLLRTTTSNDDKGRPYCPVLFLDIKKAFDRVDHTILLDRLHGMGVHGKAWLWIRSFLSDRRMRAVDDSLCSNWHHVGYGVPQGCVLSPLLFLVFIEPAITAIARDKACSLYAPVFFADDGALVPRPLHRRPPTLSITDLNAKYRDGLAAAVAQLDHWCRDSRMEFGSAKTAVVVFHSSRQSPADVLLDPYRNYQVCNFNIQLSTSYTYLGVDLSARQLSWTAHIERALATCRAASARAMRVTTRAVEPSIAAVRALVLSYVIPSCMYGAMWWARGLSDTTARSFQKAFIGPLRAALCLPKNTHQLSVAVLCGVPTVRAITATDELRFVSRLRKLQQSRARAPDRHHRPCLRADHLPPQAGARAEPAVLAVRGHVHVLHDHPRPDGPRPRRRRPTPRPRSRAPDLLATISQAPPRLPPARSRLLGQQRHGTHQCNQGIPVLQGAAHQHPLPVGSDRRLPDSPDDLRYRQLDDGPAVDRAAPSPPATPRTAAHDDGSAHHVPDRTRPRLLPRTRWRSLPPGRPTCPLPLQPRVHAARPLALPQGRRRRPARTARIHPAPPRPAPARRRPRPSGTP